ncbi:MAG: hypothetical protein KDC92_12985 [Bacteroidetes bacterium]|nr:hypothetical protein [Bacteroidota bacterium]
MSKAASENQFKAYPNPSKGQIQFNLPLQDLKVWNAQGQQVIHEDGNTSQNITIQQKGMFWIMGKAPDGQNVVSQVIVE